MVGAREVSLRLKASQNGAHSPLFLLILTVIPCYWGYTLGVGRVPKGVLLVKNGRISHVSDRFCSF